MNVSVQAVKCLERDACGGWHCRADMTISGPLGDVNVPRGTRFAPHTVYAGYNDFSSYLDSLAAKAH
jgi:hypothetical protein